MLYSFLRFASYPNVKKIGIFGIGSPFGDDQLGWELIDTLQHCREIQRFLPKYLHIKICDRPGTRLLNDWTDCGTVFLIDALITDHLPGTVIRLEDAAIEHKYQSLSTHGFGLSHTLALGKALGNFPSKIILYGINIGSHTLLEAVVMSYSKEKLLEQLLNEILMMCHKY